MELTSLIERTQEVRKAVVNPNVKQRMAEAAQALTLAGYNQSCVELLNESVFRFITTLYEIDADGRPANIDPRTYRLLIPAPWGKAGWKRWKMREWEATILRKALMVRAEMRRVPPLFDFGGGQWFLNRADYKQLDLALLYWKQQPITLREWHLFADILRQQARERMDKRRGNR